MMAKTSNIEWTDATWNPWMGCTKVSPGCKNCYMFRDQKRYGHDPTVLRRSKTTFTDPLKWKEPKRIFVCSWGDFFHEDVPPDWRRDAWDIMRQTPQHTYMLLTKRPVSIIPALPKTNFESKNIWIGVSVESQEHISRISYLYNLPFPVKFLSAEPLLGPLDLSEHMGLLDWVIVGGESDFVNPRSCEPFWVGSIMAECKIHGVPFFFKQWGGSTKIDGAWGGRELAGRTWDEIPKGDL